MEGWSGFTVVLCKTNFFLTPGKKTVTATWQSSMLLKMTGIGNLEHWIKDSLGCGALGQPFSPLESGNDLHTLFCHLHMVWYERGICPHSCRCLGETACASGSRSPDFLCTQSNCSFWGAGLDLWDTVFYRHTRNDLHQTSCVVHRELVPGDEGGLLFQQVDSPPVKHIYICCYPIACQ